MTVSEQTLIVPISVEALCVGKGDDTKQSFVRPKADFSELPFLDQNYKPKNKHAPISENLLNPPFESNTSLDSGVHLHWALPDALTHGYHDAEGDRFVFPDAPNRWLVTRFWNTGSKKKSRSWVVESNYLQTKDGDPAPGHDTTVPQLYQNINQKGPTWSYMGRFVDFKTWQEGEGATPSPDYFPHLNALGYGDTMFAALYQNCRGVFGFYDDLNEPDFQSGPIQISYTLSGWYSPGATDVLAPGWVQTLLKLNGITPTTRAENLLKALGFYKWRLTSTAAVAALSQTFCSGVVVSLQWDPSGDKSYFSTDPIVDLTIGIGNTRTEAFSAVLAQQMNTSEYGDLETLLNALQYGILPEAAGADGMSQLDELLHQNSFQAGQGGPIWTMSPPKDGVKGQLQEVSLPAAIAEALNHLNDGTKGKNGQAQYNRDSAELEDLRWRIFTYWYKYMVLRYGSAYFHPPPGLPTVQQIHDFLEKLVGNPQEPGNPFEIKMRETDLAALEVDLTAAAVALQTQLKQAKSSYIVGQVPGPRYWQPNEPVLLFKGQEVTPTPRYGGDGRFAGGFLVCRIGPELITQVKGAHTTYSTAALPHLPKPSTLPAQFAALDGLYQEGWLFELIYRADPNWKKLIQTLQNGTQKPGLPPSPLEITVWATPWLPIEIAWEVKFLAAGTTAATGLSVPYGPDYIAEFYSFDSVRNDFVYKGPAPDPQLFSSYRGRAAITPGAVDLKGQILNSLRYQDDAELKTIAEGLGQLPLSAQGMGGFNDAFLMRKLTMQLQVIDLIGNSKPLLQFTNQNVRRAVADTNITAPLPDGVVYCPIRAGFATLSGLRIIDAFGRYRKLSPATKNLNIAEVMKPPPALNLDGYFALPPRLVQAARLLFRWLSAEADLVEMNAHPATSPVCGWLLPNYLDDTLLVFGAGGTFIGFLAVDPGGSAVDFYAAPGLSPTAFEQLIANMNKHLKNLIDGLTADSTAFFHAFLKTTNQALGRVEPENYKSVQGLAVLMGRPLAVTRTLLKIELRDLPATDVGWQAFAQIVNSGEPDKSVTHAFPQVNFPVFLGDPGKLNDGLLGYFVEGGAAAYQSFYAPVATRDDAGVKPVGPGLPLDADPTSAPTTLTMLVDPRASVHAVSGIFPAKAIQIPADQYQNILKRLDVTFNISPILTQSAQLKLPLPSETNGKWSWLEQDGSNWNTVDEVFKPSDRAVFYDSGQLLRGGWLKLTRAFGELGEPAPPPSGEVDQGVHLALTIGNDSNLGSGLPKLFISNDSSINILTFSLTNPSKIGLTLSSAQTLLTITPPAALFTSAELGKVTVAGGDWSIELNSGRFTNWTLKPKQDLTLGAQQCLSFKLTGITISKQNAVGKGFYWNVAWKGITNALSDTVQRRLFVYRQGPQNLAMEFSISPDTRISVGQKPGTYSPVYTIPGFPQFTGEVFITAPQTSNIYTQFLLTLTNNGDQVNFSEQSQFTLNFVISADDQNDIGALSRADNIKNMLVEQLYNDPQKKWAVVQQQGQDTKIDWLLSPGSHIALQPNEVVQFQIGAVFTTLPAYPTPIYLSYANIPGALDGVFHGLLTKITTPAAITELSVDGTSILAAVAGLPESPEDAIYKVALEQQVNLGWTTVGVSAASLLPKRGDGIPVPISGTHAWVPFSKAEDAGTITLATTPTTDLGNTWSFSLQPVAIVSFLANGEKSLVTAAGPVTISWQTQYASAVTLTDQGGRTLAHFDRPTHSGMMTKGSFKVSLQATDETYTLSADGYQGAVAATLQIVIKPTPVTLAYDPNQGPSGTVTVDYDFSLIDYDLIQVEMSVFIQKVAVCKHHNTITASTPKKGSFKYPIPVNRSLPAGSYKVVSDFLFSKNKAGIGSLKSQFIFTVGQTSSQHILLS